MKTTERPGVLPLLSRLGVWRFPIRVLLIAAAVFLVYWPALHGAFIGDDVWYLLRNPVLRDPGQLWRIWFDPGSWVEFYPIEESILSLEWHFWQIDTLGYHLTTICLHILNALLVWHLLRKLGLPLAWLGGLIFAIHPEQVDSVAQVAELKNTLSLSPFIVAMCFYLDYDQTHSRKSYLWSVMAFLAAMLCKITMAPFPLLILLYAWWKRGRISWDDVRVCLPFAIISLLLGMMTIWSGEVYGHSLARDWNGGSTALGGFFFRVVLVAQTLAYYFSRSIWPLHPVPVYPQWPVEPSHPLQWIPWLVIILACAWFWHRRETWGKHALLGIGFFVIFLLPFLGWHAITYMRATWVLDHMLYIPMIGLIGLFVAALGDLSRKIPTPARYWGVAILAVWLSLLGLQSNLYAGKFTDAETLDRYALQLYPDNGVLHYFLGSALQDEHDYAGAIAEFRIALRSSGPNEPESNGPLHAQMGDIYLEDRRPSEAAAEYRRARKLHHQPVEMMVDEATALIYEHNLPEGVALLRQAVQTDPSSATAQYNLAKVLCMTGQTTEGIARYRKALRLRPGYAEAHNNLGIALARQGQNSDALKEFQLALDANPSFASARRNLEIVQAIVANPSAAR
jgi:tetratricopeptide (TPR) repeat protein